MECTRIEEQCRTVHLQRGDVSVSEAEQIPVAAPQFLLKLRQMPVCEADALARSFNRAEPTVKMIACLFGGKSENFALAVHISENKMGFDSLKRPDDITAADVAAVDDRLNVMFLKESHGSNRFVQTSVRVADNAEF